jgi:hypothetical protein
MSFEDVAKMIDPDAGVPSHTMTDHFVVVVTVVALVAKIISQRSIRSGKSAGETV